MTPFDPKNKKEAPGYLSRRKERSEEPFHREDARGSAHQDFDVSPFTRDKRPRTNHTEYSDNRSRQGERRSFNSNFDKENRFRGSSSSYKERDTDKSRSTFHEDSHRSDDRSRYPARPHPQDDRRSFHREDSTTHSTEKTFSRFKGGSGDNARPWTQHNERSGNQSDHRSYKQSSDRPWKEHSDGSGKQRSDRPGRQDQDRPWRTQESRPWKERSNGSGNQRSDRPGRQDQDRPWRTKEPRSGGETEHSSGFSSNRDNSHAFSDRNARQPYGEKRTQRPSRDASKGGRTWKNKREHSQAYPRFDAPRPQGAVRLNRFIANSGICSRREADDLIVAGVVSINGQVITELGSKVNPDDEVRFNGEIIKGEKKVYILMNKPKGFVTSMEDPHADKTVMDLIKGACSERVYPVGRLDKNTVGVLLFTNDGELTRTLTHPSYNKQKIYQVTLDKALTESDMSRIAEGITLEDGLIFADEISYADESRREIGVEIHSGRNRIVRRIFESLGYSVLKLDRVYFAGLTKKRLKRGGWRFLTPQEVAKLKSGAYE